MNFVKSKVFTFIDQTNLNKSIMYASYDEQANLSRLVKRSHALIVEFGCSLGNGIIISL